MRKLILRPKALAVGALLSALAFPLAIPASSQLSAAPIPIATQRGGMYCRFYTTDICFVNFAPRESESNAVLKLEGQTATIELSAATEEKKETISLFEDWPVPAEAARKLGCGSGCTLLKGEYRVNYSESKFGVVEGIRVRQAKR